MDLSLYKSIHLTYRFNFKCKIIIKFVNRILIAQPEFIQIMKVFIIVLVFFSTAKNNFAYAENNFKTTTSFVLSSYDLPKNMQSKIQNAFAKDMASKNLVELNQIAKNLKILYKNKNNNVTLYWMSFLQFYKATYYLEVKDEDLSEEEIDKGVEWMSDMKNKNSDDYALLSMLKGFSTQFKGFRAMFIGISSGNDIDKALELDDQNIRAYYVAGTNDFYRPETFGGGKKVESYLLKALNLPDKKSKNQNSPSWGREESYYILTLFYIRKKKMDLARKYFDLGINSYPKSYFLNQLSVKLKRK